MIEVLQFIFQDFAHWAGTLLMLIVIFDGIGNFFNRSIKIVRRDK